MAELGGLLSLSAQRVERLAAQLAVHARRVADEEDRVAFAERHCTP
jgi:hypothetical protein